MRCYRIQLFVVCSLLFFININAQFFLERRSSCTTPNGDIARCIPISSCPILYDAVTTRDKQQLKFLKESQCGYGRDPLVCCGLHNNYRLNPGDFAYDDEPFGWGNSHHRRNSGSQNWDRDDTPSWGNERKNNNNNNEWSTNNRRRTTTQRTNSEESGWGISDRPNRRTSGEESRWSTSDRPNRRTSGEESGWGTTDRPNRRTSGEDSSRRNNNRRTTTQRTNSEESSFEREDDRFNDRTNSGSNSNRQTSQGSGSTDKSECGVQEVDRILDGQATDLREFPWMALLQYRKKSGNLVFSCGGTLISPRYVLTAAHCVRGQILTKIGPLVNVRLGEYNTETERDCSNQMGFEICNEKPIDSEIDKVIPHPDYSDNSADRYHDIALIKLKRQVSYTDFIKPICLPGKSEKTSVGKRLAVAGWGRTEYASNSPVKLKLWVPVAETSQCSSKFKSAGVTLGNRQLCAGGEQGRDSCNGDSGGPLMAVRNATAQWYIEGIVSFGARCGSEGWPGIYTRVSEYLDWIQNNTN
ncbi:serine protease P8 [Tribolium castaneum]|uniref:CLIP domain-containing serine protease n=3 Tax=Tribolium castaneum TaxID=7070 RepID=A0A139WN30_TRICA|nr:serine protease P8 [Tribolium castaneum]